MFAVCGHGIQKRNVACQREDGVDVGNHLCESEGEFIPDLLMACEIHCALDCEVSEWGEWEPCSHVCGYGQFDSLRPVHTK